MSTLAGSMRGAGKQWPGFAAGFVGMLILAAVAVPNLYRSREAADRSSAIARVQTAKPVSVGYYVAPTRAKEAMLDVQQDGLSAGVLKAVVAPRTAASLPAPDASTGRKIVRTSSLEMVVQHPAEVADRIAAIAESLGGYVVNADNGGPNATGGMLTIRVPAARFDAARTEIRKLGLRIENEKTDAADVTQQYVDQDARLRNLRAEEGQYLTILKQAGTVKDMLAVSEKLSEVRGQIEQQQAELNSLSQQIDTVAITISLRAEAEAQVFGLNWRPLYQLKLAFRDGLDSVATYATAMTTILFYLPATLLWLETILGTTFCGWRLLRWIGRRWFGWKVPQAAAQG
jgi:hypothetical protein